MNFVAIDFETANEKRNSPCSLGITVIKDNQIIEEKYWLIRPKELRFNPMNIRIHGIRPEDVANESEFDELWPEIHSYLEGNLIIAHNASFDLSVLRSTLDRYNIPYPILDYGCTMVMSKQFYPYLEDSKLNTVSHHLGYRFNHHHASADATACANILLKIIDELELDEIDELADTIGITVGKLHRTGYVPCRTKGKSITSRREYLPEPQQRLSPTLTEDYFHDKFVAFTGGLNSMSRAKAISIVEQLGATYTPSVTRKTNLLIIGGVHPDFLAPEQRSTKMRRAIELIGRGQEITLLTEDQLFR